MLEWSCWALAPQLTIARQSIIIVFLIVFTFKDLKTVIPVLQVFYCFTGSKRICHISGPEEDNSSIIFVKVHRGARRLNIERAYFFLFYFSGGYLLILNA